MKKSLVILLAVVMVFTLVTATACQESAITVRVNLYVTEDADPIIRKHIIGQDDLPPVTNGSLIFDGWYYDKEFNREFKSTDVDIADGTSLYAKWKQGGSSTDEKVTLILNPNYAGALLQTEQLNKGATYNLPTPVNPDGSRFDG